MSALAAIHIKRKRLGLDMDDFRDVVERMTGQRSTRGLKPKQATALLGELDRLSGGAFAASQRPLTGVRKPLEGPYAKKIQALWISMWNLGLVSNRDDAALSAFVLRQTPLDHANWLRTSEDAVAVIEALKSWMATRGGVNWGNDKGDPDYMRLPGYKVAAAQWRIVNGLEPYSDYTLVSYVQFLTGKRFVAAAPSDWIVVMNTLGQVVRREKKRQSNLKEKL